MEESSLKRQNDFSAGSIPKAIMRMAIPITLAQLVNILYSLVDRMYIGHLENSGDALAGLGICMPIILIVSAFARLCGEGGAPFCSIERGKGNIERAEKILGNSFGLLLFAGIVLTVLGNVFMESLLYLFGADENTYEYALPYCRIYLTGSVFVMISLGLNHYINSQGFAKKGMLTVAIGAVINIVLDPIFIYVFDMGVTGAALATVIAQFFSALWVMFFLCGKKAQIRLRMKNMKLEANIVKTIFSMGIAGFVMSVTSSAVQGVSNRMLLSVGGSVYIGVMTVISSARELVILPVNGITGGGHPVLGYNYGAKRYDRVKACIRCITVLAAVYNVFVWLVLLILPGQIMALFTDDAAILSQGIVPFRVYFMCYCTMALSMGGQMTFTGMGMAKHATFFSVLRKVIVALPLMIILPRVGDLGVLGVFLAEPISEVVCGAVCYTSMMFTVYKKMDKLQKEQENEACSA